MVGSLKAARAAALNDAYMSPFKEWDLSNATHTASMAPLAFAANDNRDGEAAVASWSLSCGCGCGKGWTSFFRDGIGDRVRVPGVDTVTNPLLIDNVGNSPETARAITVGSTTYAIIEDFNDKDFFSVTLVAGQSYAISQLLHVGGTATGDGTLLSGVPLADAYLELYGPDGVTLLAEADGGSNTTPSGLDAKLFFTPTETGTYFINARSFDMDPTNGTDGDYVGDYTLNVRAVDASEVPLPRFYSAAGQAPNALLDSLDWGSTWDHTVRNPDGNNGTRTDNGVADGGTPITNTEYGIVGKNVMKFYFAKQGDVFLSDDPLNPGLETTLQARNMEQWEKDAFLATMDIYEQVTDLKYIEVDNRADADIKIIIYPGTPGVGASLLGRMSPPGEQNEGQTEINAGDYRWTEEGVRPGGFFFPTLLHEWGHGHGMKHPHDNGGGGPTMRGAEPSDDPVEGAIGGQFGDFGLSQQMYTIMSYNDGWNETGGVGGRPAGHGGPSSGGLEMQADHFGWMGTLGALDIALLQDKYGVNEEWATGDDVYTIEDTNEAGHYYRTIWDGGGNDEIRYVGSRNATIDLRAATLQYEEGGGGRVSYALGAWTGFTIANGVDIERATGGDGDDILTGNALANTLIGGGGADQLFGGAGTDRLYGGDGADLLNAGAGVAGEFQYLYGEGGDDTYVYGTEAGLVYISSGGEGASTGAADRVVFTDLNGWDVTLGHQDYRDSYPAEGLATMIMWQKGQGSGQLQIANEARDIEAFQFADGAVFDTLQIAPGTGGSYVSTGAGASADLIFGGGGTDRLYGGDGDDLLNAGAGVAGEFQYLYGEGGDDTYVYGTEAGLVYISSSEGATTGTADRVVLTDLNAWDVSLGYQDYRGSYPTEGLALMIMWQTAGASGQLQIANEARDIESFQFADGAVFDTLQLAPEAGGTYVSTGAGASADLIFGGAGTDRLYGGDGADVLNAGAGVAGQFQYLYGEGGNDTYVYGTEAGLVYISSSGEGATTGTADRVVFTDLNVADVTIGYQDYRESYPTEGLALMIMWQNGQGSGQLQIANEGRDIESFQFADGSVLTALQLAALGPAAASEAEPQVLPRAPDDRPKDETARDDGPQTLPGPDDGFATTLRDALGRTDFGTRDGDTEETASLFDTPADDGYLFAATKDGIWPEVLPAIDDGFVLTGKFNDVPPVMPTEPDIFDAGGASMTELEMARELLMSLARENPFDTSGDSLLLADEWSGFAPNRDAVWA